MNDELESRFGRLKDWLEENVQIYLEPELVRLYDFAVNWEDFSGEFRVAFDSVVLSEKLRFSLEASGKTTFNLPMFHSPLGVPASYSAIEITAKTQKAILEGLRETVPRVKGAGLDRETGKSVSFHTPPAERIDPAVLRNAKATVTGSYSIIVEVKNQSS